MSRQPGSINNIVPRDPRAAVADEFREVWEAINQLRTERKLDSATVGGDGMQSENFDGTLEPATVGTAGWGLSGATGNAIFNDIVLRGGIIGNDALISPVAVATADGVAAGLTYDSTERTYDTESMAVPAGFTQALVFATATAGLSATVGGSNISVRPVIDGTNGDLISSLAGANIYMSVSSTFARIVTGLSGGSITVSVRAFGTTGGVVAGSGNARVSAIALFLR